MDKRIIIYSDASKIKERDNKYQLGCYINNIYTENKIYQIKRIEENHINIAELKGIIFALEYILNNIKKLKKYNIFLHSDNMFVTIFIRECFRQLDLLSKEGKDILIKKEKFIMNNKQDSVEFIRIKKSLSKQKFTNINYVLKILLLIQKDNKINIKWIPRKDNYIADKLSKISERNHSNLNIESIIKKYT